MEVIFENSVPTNLVGNYILIILALIVAMYISLHNRILPVAVV